MLESMRNAGLDARALEPSDLAGDLSQLDVIVVGPGAAARPELDAVQLSLSRVRAKETADTGIQ